MLVLPAYKGRAHWPDIRCSEVSRLADHLRVISKSEFFDKVPTTRRLLVQSADALSAAEDLAAAAEVVADEAVGSSGTRKYDARIIAAWEAYRRVADSDDHHRVAFPSDTPVYLVRTTVARTVARE